jgi:hypothetical protein
VGGCGGLVWEKAYVLNDKHMCPDPHDGSCSGTGWHYCAYQSCVSWVTWQKEGCLALLHKGTPIPICTLGNCNPVNFTVLKSSDWEQGHMAGIKINGKGYNLGFLLYFKLVTINHESSSYQVFHSFYEEMKSEFPIFDKMKNLFLHWLSL